jgi:hypothetical protein
MFLHGHGVEEQAINPTLTGFSFPSRLSPCCLQMRMMGVKNKEISRRPQMRAPSLFSVLFLLLFPRFGSLRLAHLLVTIRFSHHADRAVASPGDAKITCQKSSLSLADHDQRGEIAEVKCGS